MAANQETGTKRPADEEAGDAKPPKELKLTVRSEPEAVKGEPEQDAADDKRTKSKEHVGFDLSDATLNVIPASGGRVLMALTDQGLHHLLAGARANVGIKSGRYYFEMKILETWSPDGALQPAGKGRPAQSRQHIRVGFSLTGSSLFLGETDDSICFDADGALVVNKKKTSLMQKFGKEQTFGVLLNCSGPGEEAVGSVSLFRDGVRMTEPQPLPENLRGKALFPHVCFRGATLQFNFGAVPAMPLAFKCPMLQGAAQEDIEVSQTRKTGKDGKFDVLFPVSLPDEGGFDWLDSFLEKNPHVTELSDRKMLDWALKSGLWKPPKRAQVKDSLDKPDMNFSIPALDDFSACKFIQNVAPLVPRNYIVMELKSNLVEAERKELVKRFRGPQFRRIAKVMVGEPPEDIKSKAHAELLEEKQKKVDQEWQSQKVEKERQRQIAKRQRDLAKLRKAAEKAKAEAEARRQAEAEAAAAAARKAEEETQKAAEEATKKEGSEVPEPPASFSEKEGAEGTKDGEAKDDGEEKKCTDAAEKSAGDDADAKTDNKSEDKTGMDVDKSEEKAIDEQKDVTMEEKKDETIEEKKDESTKENKDEATEAKKDEPMSEKKNEATEEKKVEENKDEKQGEEKQVEDEDKSEEEPADEETEPPKAELTEEEKKQWFLPKATPEVTTSAVSASLGSFSLPALAEGFDAVEFEWNSEDMARSHVQKWIDDRKLTMRMEDLVPSEWFKKRFADWQERSKEWQQRQKDVKSDPMLQQRQEARELRAAEKEAEQADQPGEDGKKKEKEKADMELEEFDIFAVEDVIDVGNGEPLFLNFEFEDWALLQLRFELELLIRSFSKDAPDRPGMTDQHAPFYYSKYYRKTLNPKLYGVAGLPELAVLVKDTVGITQDNQVLMTHLTEDAATFEMFVKLTEEQRRERQRRLDAGDGTAKLDFSALSTAQQQLNQLQFQQQQQQQQGYGMMGMGGMRPNVAVPNRQFSGGGGGGGWGTGASPKMPGAWGKGGGGFGGMGGGFGNQWNTGGGWNMGGGGGRGRWG